MATTRMWSPASEHKHHQEWMIKQAESTPTFPFWADMLVLQFA